MEGKGKLDQLMNDVDENALSNWDDFSFLRENEEQYSI